MNHRICFSRGFWYRPRSNIELHSRGDWNFVKFFRSISLATKLEKNVNAPVGDIQDDIPEKTTINPPQV